jgi:hypothetical protein
MTDDYAYLFLIHDPKKVLNGVGADLFFSRLALALITLSTYLLFFYY